MAAKALFVLSIALQVSASGANSLRQCNIVVIDAAGAELGKAHVLVHNNLLPIAESPDRLMDVDAHGKLTFKIANGIYDICVMSPAFAPSCQVVNAKDKDPTVRFKLKVSAVVSEQISDKFPTH